MITTKPAVPMVKPADVDPTPEPLYYFRSKKLYKGKWPPYYDVSDMPGTKILADNYEAIRHEILAYYEHHEADIPLNDIPYGNYEDPGWKQVNLYSLGLKDRDSCSKLPVLTSVLEQIPNMIGSTVSILAPQTRIHTHIGSTSALVRTHLGISIPAEAPQVAFKVCGMIHGWAEGEMFGIEQAYRHTAWNKTDTYRIVVTVDTIKDEYAARPDRVCGRALGLMVMWKTVNRWPRTQKVPEPALSVIHTGLSGAVIVLLKSLRALKLQPPMAVMKTANH